MNPVIQNIIIVLGLVAIATVGYYTFVVMGQSELQTDNTSISLEAQLASQNFLQNLNELKTVDLRTDLYTNPRFRSLQDTSVAPTPRSTGRVNPFEAR